jgi:hypothetical protein
MVELGHTRLDQVAQLACVLIPHYLLVDINVAKMANPSGLITSKDGNPLVDG